jgi:hypothetical protein
VADEQDKGETMISISFWARGDNATAANSSINSLNTSTVPVTELTFVAVPGASEPNDPYGDILLDPNNGGVDPDTQVIINGVQMNFTVEFSGYLPMTKKFTDLGVGGKEVVVITAGGQRYYFITDGSGTYEVMSALPSGSIPITGVTTQTVVVCFAGGTQVATPTGERSVDELKVGDLVLTADGAVKPIRWIGRREISVADLIFKKELRPICISAGSFGPGMPHSDLYLSRQHQLAVEGWTVEMLFGEDRVLARAGHLETGPVRSVIPAKPVVYYHVLLDEHDLLIANGLAAESFQPGPVGLCALDDAARAELEALDPALLLKASTAIAPSLRAYETQLLLPHLFASQPTIGAEAPIPLAA